MKRLGVMSFMLLVLLVVFAACGTGQTEYAQEYVCDVQALTAAVNDMRDARAAATTLGAFADTAVIQPLSATPVMHNPLDLGNGPTRSQFTLLLDGVTSNGQAVQEISNLRPGLDVTVYSDPANIFYYIEGGLRFLGMPFPIVNIGVNGAEVSARVPLLYDRYFAVDTKALIDEFLPAEMKEYMGDFMGQYSEFWASINDMAELIEDAIDFETLIIDVFAGLLEVAEVEVDGNTYSLIIPADDATEALGVIWDAIFEMYALIDVSAFNGDFEDEWDYFLTEGRENFDRILFSRDVMLSYVLEDGVVMGVVFEGFLGDYYFDDELRIHVSYSNNSGDHVGDINWVFEIEDLHPNWPMEMRFEYAVSLNTEDGYYNRGRISMFFEDRWDAFDISADWYLNRTKDNEFNAGLAFTFEDEFEDAGISLSAQGSMSHGVDYFVFDMDSLVIDVHDDAVDVKVELSAHFMREVILPEALPVINPADQFFVMDASEDEIEYVMQQVMANFGGLSSIFEMFGF